MTGLSGLDRTEARHANDDRMLETLGTVHRRREVLVRLDAPTARLDSRLHAGRRQHGKDHAPAHTNPQISHLYNPNAVFAMISFITSSVPAPMRINRESRKYREIPVSAM